MYAEERRALMIERAREHGRVEVAALAAELAVNPETIRRDLSELERRGLVRRVHGGAIPVERLRSELFVSDRVARNAAEKGRIATAALAQLPETGTVLLDAGTTTGALAAVFPTDRELRVVTNAVTIAVSLATEPNVEVYLVGGRVRSRTMASVGARAVADLEDLLVDVVFVSANGVSHNRGLTTADPSEAAVKRAMVLSGRRVVLLADHSKVGQEHFVRFAELREVDLLITDDGLDEEDLRRFEQAGLAVLRA